MPIQAPIDYYYYSEQLTHVLMTGHPNLKCRISDLIAQGADVNYISRAISAPNSPLLSACIHNREVEIVRLLITAGADVNASPRRVRITPLMVSSRSANDNIVVLLLNSGANVNTTDRHGYTALHYACESGQFGAVKCLIAAGSNINARNQLGNTPLMLACGKRANECSVKYLLEHGADPFATNLDAKNAIDLALIKKGTANTIAILLKHGVLANTSVGNIVHKCGYFPLVPSE